MAISSQSEVEDVVSCDLYGRPDVGPRTPEQEKWVLQSTGNNIYECPPYFSNFGIPGNCYRFDMSWSGTFQNSKTYCQSLDPDADLAGNVKLWTSIYHVT